MNTWVLVANASKARIFGTEKVGYPMECMKEFTHPESRGKGMDLTSDRPGHYQSKGTGHGAFIDATEPKEYEADRFAAELAKELENGRNNKAYRKLVVVAAPHFHGLINSHLNDHTRAMIVNNIQKDFTDCDASELQGRLKELM